MDLIQETYVDGIASISVRQSVAKFDFYQASLVANEEGSEEQKEVRKLSYRLTLPMAGLIEMYEILGNIVKETKENAKK
ncbi:MAG: hypothetical protein FE834_01570 [Gammaproteobacteria bacterium]|nr:hypothetical protein [Gammaproteobacteria bacterium]